MGREARSAHALMFASNETYVITSSGGGSAIMLKAICSQRTPAYSQMGSQPTANRFQKRSNTHSNSASVLDHPFWLPSELALELSWASLARLANVLASKMASR